MLIRTFARDLALALACTFAVASCAEPDANDRGGPPVGGAQGGAARTAPSDDAEVCCTEMPSITECGEGRTCPVPMPVEWAESIEAISPPRAVARTTAPDLNEEFDMVGVVAADCPGCDGYPDTVCTTHCCAEHDRCYARNGCTAASWCDGKTDACDDCNAAVVGCILTYGLWGCKVDWPFDGQPRACEAFRCGCDKEECFDAATNRTYCAASC